MMRTWLSLLYGSSSSSEKLTDGLLYTLGDLLQWCRKIMISTHTAATQQNMIPTQTPKLSEAEGEETGEVGAGGHCSRNSPSQQAC
jgi:hypothetical protein